MQYGRGKFRIARRVSRALLQKWVTVHGTGVRNVTLLVNRNAYGHDTVHPPINGFCETYRAAINDPGIDDL